MDEARDFISAALTTVASSVHLAPITRGAHWQHQPRDTLLQLALTTLNIVLAPLPASAVGADVDLELDCDAAGLGASGSCTWIPALLSKLFSPKLSVTTTALINFCKLAVHGCWITPKWMTTSFSSRGIG